MDIVSKLLVNTPHTSTLPQGERGTNDLKKAAKEFESYFISYMLKEMRKTVPADSLLGGGRGEEIYRSFQDEELAKSMVESGGIGLSDIIIRDLSGALKSNQYPADKGIA
ncbi:MAG: rod-binding protein, partial [Nitrospirota bacterium]